MLRRNYLTENRGWPLSRFWPPSVCHVYGTFFDTLGFQAFSGQSDKNNKEVKINTKTQNT
jgi:hypothetical protein